MSSNNNSALAHLLAVVLHQAGGQISVPNGNLEVFAQSEKRWNIVQSRTATGETVISLDMSSESAKVRDFPDEFMSSEMPENILVSV